MASQIEATGGGARHGATAWMTLDEMSSLCGFRKPILKDGVLKFRQLWT